MYLFGSVVVQAEACGPSFGSAAAAFEQQHRERIVRAERTADGIGDARMVLSRSGSELEYPASDADHR